MTPCQQILEQYCIATRYSRRSPNVLIISPEFELRVLAEIVDNEKASNIYKGLRIVHSKDVETFELAFICEVTHV
jgi:hypothetical protein